MKITVSFFFCFNSRGPREKAGSGPEKPDVHVAKPEPAGSQRRESNTFPKAIVVRRTLTAKGEAMKRSNKGLQPQSPSPMVGASEPAPCKTTTPWSRSQPSRQGTGSTGQKELEFGVFALEKLSVQSESQSTLA